LLDAYRRYQVKLGPEVMAANPQLAANVAEAANRCKALQTKVDALVEIYLAGQEERDAYRLGQAAREEYLALEREYQDLQRRAQAAEAAKRGGPPLSEDAPPTVPPGKLKTPGP
jgi:hypothetical protein